MFKSYTNLKWCELGDQIDYNKIIAKTVYEKKGVNHISIDISGFNGAVPLNLNYKLPFVFDGVFDVITNYGTSEHVEDQYMLFKNIHKMCKRGTIIIHVVPLKDNWINHCRYYYTLRFFVTLGKLCNYNLIYSNILFKSKQNQNTIIQIYKHTFGDFVSRREFNKIQGLIDTKNNNKVNNYFNKSLKTRLIDFFKYNGVP